MGSHKKKSRRHSRSRSRSSNDHKSRQKSQKTRRRSSSSSSDSPYRGGRSSKSSRYRSRSRSYSPSRRRRSQSRSYDDYARRRRRSRSNSRSRRSHSRRRSRSRSRSTHRERRRRSSSGSRSRHSSRKCSPTERDKLKGKQAKDEKTSSDPAPSNLLKQKMQKALENASGAPVPTETTSKKKEVNEDDPEMKKELKRLEKDSFRQMAFKSSRWDLNPVKPSSSTSRLVSLDQSHDLAIFGGSVTNGSAHPTLQHPNVAALLYRPNWKLTCESLRASPQEKMDRWIEKLQMWRKKRIDEAEYT